MTYNPPPYQPPPGPPGYSAHPGFVDPLAPARKAAVMCWVLGGLGLLCGLCLNGVAFLAPPEAMVQELRARLSPEQLHQFGNMDLATAVKITYAVMGVVALVVRKRFGKTRMLSSSWSVTAATAVMPGRNCCSPELSVT